MRLELSVIRMVLATALGKPAFWLALAVIAAAGLACSGCGFPVPVLVASYLCCGAPACLIGLWRRSRQRRELVRLLDGSLRGRSPVLVSEILAALIAVTPLMVVVFLLAEGTAGEGGAPWQLWVTIPLVATASAALSSILGRYQASAASLLLVVLLTGPGLTRVAPPAIGLVFLPLYPASTCAWSAQGAQPGLHPDTYLAAALVMAVAAVWTSMRLGRTGKD